MTVLDILAAGNKMLQRFYGGEIKIYGREISDGYQTPAFFTEVVSGGYQYGTKKYGGLDCSFKITYFSKTPDAVELMQKAEELKEIFGQSFPVGDRKLTVSGYYVSYIGERNQILQVTIEFQKIVDFKENKEEQEAELMTELVVNKKEV